MIANRYMLLIAGLSAGLMGTIPVARSFAANAGGTEPGMARPILLAAADQDGPKPKPHDKDDDDDKHGEAGEKDEKHEWEEKKEIEQDVPMNMVPQAVIDAVVKECPGGKITEPALEAKRGKIMWSFDVAVGDAKYDVKITVDGKFFEKKVDDDDEHDEKHDEKK